MWTTRKKKTIKNGEKNGAIPKDNPYSKKKIGGLLASAKVAIFLRKNGINTIINLSKRYRNMIDNRLNSEIGARIWKTVAEFLERKGCNDKRYRNSYILYLYASGMGMKEIAERLGLVRERVRQILVREVDGMTNAARMDGYFALQERYDQLQIDYDTLRQQYDLLQRVAKKNIPNFVSVKALQREILNTKIAETEMPELLRHKLQSAGYEYVWQIVEKDEKSLTTGRKLAPSNVKKIKEYLDKYGLKLDMELSVGARADM